MSDVGDKKDLFELVETPLYPFEFLQQKNCINHECIHIDKNEEYQCSHDLTVKCKNYKPENKKERRGGY